MGVIVSIWSTGKDPVVKLKNLLTGAVIALGGAMVSIAPASAAMLTGQLDITGIVNVQNSSFQAGGSVDFDPQTSSNVLIATGDFTPFSNTTFDLFDLSLTGPELVYSGDGLSFTATNYLDFDNAFPGRSFEAVGVLTLAGYDDTPAMLTLSTQSNNPSQIMASFSSSTTPTPTPIPLPASVLMLFAALGGLGVLSRRRTAIV